MTDDLAPKHRLRLEYAKGEPLRYISHLDLARAWERVFRRAALPVAYSQGFNPRPRFQIAAALPVGVTGRAEYLDLWLAGDLAPQETIVRLGPALPPGLEVLAVTEIDLRAPSLQSQMRAARYRVTIHSPETAEAIGVRVEALLAASALPRQRHHKGKMQSYDLRPLVQHLAVRPGEAASQVLDMLLQASPQGAGRPDQVLDALGLFLAPHAVERTNLCFEFDK